MTDNISGLPSGPSSPSVSPVPSDTKTAQSSSPTMKTADTIGSAGISLGMMNNVAPPVPVDPASPVLPQPDPDGQSGPQPFGAAEKKLITDSFAAEVSKQLKSLHLPPDEEKALYNEILAGKIPPKAKEAVATALKNTQEGARLPASWTPESKNPKDWTPAPVKPYDAAMQTKINASYDKEVAKALQEFIANAQPPLTDAQISSLKDALATGKVGPDTAQSVIAITKKATEATQKTYGLPSTWVKGTTNPDDLKPINLGIVTPTAVAKANAQFILANVDKLATDVNKAIDNFVKSLPPDDPNRQAALEFKAVIAKAIGLLKEMMRELQVRDASRQKEITDVKVGDLKIRSEVQADQVKKTHDAMEKQKIVGPLMKILGPIITAIMTIIGAILCFFGGAGTAVIAAAIVIGTVMCTYSIIDSATGCTQRIIEAFNSWLEATFPNDETARTLVKAFIALVAVVILIIACVFTGGGAAGEVAASAATQTAIQVMKEIIKQIAEQLIIMVIMTSNVITEVIGEILKAAGVDTKSNPAWQAITMVMTMIVMMVAMARGGKPSGSSVGGAVADEAKEAAAVAAQQAAKAAEEAVEKASTNLKNMLTNALEKLSSIPGEIGKQAKELLNGLKETAKGFTKIKEVIGGAKQLAALKDELANAKDAATKAVKLAEISNLKAAIKSSATTVAESTAKSLQITAGLVSTAEGVTRAVIGVKVAKLMEELADLQEMEGVLSAIIALLEKVLASIDSGMQMSADLANSSNEVLNQFWKTQQQDAQKMLSTMPM